MQINRRTLLAAGAGLASGISLPAWAQLRIEITGVGANQIPIAIPQFQGTNNAPLDLSAVISADLERSGAFRSIKVMGELPAEDLQKPRAKFWRTMGANALVMGTVEKLAELRYRVNYRLFDISENKVTDEKQYDVSPQDLRLTAHRIADAVYEKLTGESGIFASRLAYVLQRGPKAYEQCAGFMRITGGDNPLDATSVHPETYTAVEKLFQKLGMKTEQILDGTALFYIPDYGKLASELGIGEITLKDIVKELKKPGRDPREDMPRPILRSDVLDIKDLKEGMILKGTVRNVIDFGAFVDIGVHQDGLVHISKLTNKKFVKHPLEVVSVGDVVEVKVLSVDPAKKRISLSMIL